MWKVLYCIFLFLCTLSFNFINKITLSIKLSSSFIFYALRVKSKLHLSYELIIFKSTFIFEKFQVIPFFKMRKKMRWIEDFLFLAFLKKKKYYIEIFNNIEGDLKIMNSQGGQSKIKLIINLHFPLCVHNLILIEFGYDVQSGFRYGRQ